MNILAHLYLSGDDNELKVGNFIADYVKGKKILRYPAGIAQGIRLHRAIDSFTDTHHTVKEVNSLFSHGYGKYTGVVTDILFDHYLSKNWGRYSKIEYDTYVKNTYHTLNGYIRVFPFRVVEFYAFFVFNNWLKMYQGLEGIEKVLKGMSKRTSLPGQYEFAMRQVKENHTLIENSFFSFFDELVDFVVREYNVKIDLP